MIHNQTPPQPYPNDSGLAGLRSAYVSKKLKFEKLQKTSVIATVAGVALGAIGLALLATPVGLGVVIALSAVGATIAVGGLISVLLFRFINRNYNSITFAPVLSLVEQVKEDFKSSLLSGESWNHLDDEFLRKAHTYGLFGSQLSNSLLTEFRFMLALDRTGRPDEVIMKMLKEAASTYYAVKTACRSSGTATPEQADDYEKKFYQKGSWQNDMRQEHNQACALVQALFSDESHPVRQLFQPDLEDSEQNDFEQKVRNYNERHNPLTSPPV